jgi:hypothetical protein
MGQLTITEHGHGGSGQGRGTRPVGQRMGWLTLGVFCMAFAVFEIVKHGGGALALGLGFLIAPDLAMLVGANGRLAKRQLAPRAVRYYNAVHRVWGPLALLVACTFWINSAALFTGGLAWLAHVAVDRAVGYGLRAPSGFRRG